MEEMGGLIRRMPSTALYFLIGAIAISGLPPLNGFVSEWLTYQALLAGFGATPRLTRVAFPIAGALLALTAALAAACFVKAFGITFLALPRSAVKPRKLRRSDSPCVQEWRCSRLSCVLLGLGATWFLPVFDPITRTSFRRQRQPSLVSGHGFILTAGSPAAGSVSTRLLALLLVALSGIPLLPGLRGAAANAAKPDPPGTAASRPDRRERVHRHRFLKAAAHDLRGALPAAPRDPGGVRRLALLSDRHPLRIGDRAHV